MPQSSPNPDGGAEFRPQGPEKGHGPYRAAGSGNLLALGGMPARNRSTDLVWSRRKARLPRAKRLVSQYSLQSAA
jgi:hypothetical protein